MRCGETTEANRPYVSVPAAAVTVALRTMPEDGPGVGATRAAFKAALTQPAKASHTIEGARRPKRFCFSRSAPPNPVLGRTLVSGVIQGEDLASAQASMVGVFRSRGLPDTHQSFAWQDLDEVRDPLGGLLAVTMVDQ